MDQMKLRSLRGFKERMLEDGEKPVEFYDRPLVGPLLLEDLIGTFYILGFIFLLTGIIFACEIYLARKARR